MDSETWEQVKEAIDEGQELSFDYKGDNGGLVACRRTIASY